MDILRQSVPEKMKEAGQSISQSIDFFNHQEAYYTNEEIRATINIDNLLRSKYDIEIKDGLQFLIGVTQLLLLETIEWRGDIILFC